MAQLEMSKKKKVNEPFAEIRSNMSENQLGSSIKKVTDSSAACNHNEEVRKHIPSSSTSSPPGSGCTGDS